MVDLVDSSMRSLPSVFEKVSPLLNCHSNFFFHIFKWRTLGRLHNPPSRMRVRGSACNPICLGLQLQQSSPLDAFADSSEILGSSEVSSSHLYHQSDLCFLRREFFCPLSLQCIAFASFLASTQVLHYQNYPAFSRKLS